MVVLERGAVSYEQGTPVISRGRLVLRSVKRRHLSSSASGRGGRNERARRNVVSTATPKRGCSDFLSEPVLFPLRFATHVSYPQIGIQRFANRFSCLGT